MKRILLLATLVAAISAFLGTTAPALASFHDFGVRCYPGKLDQVDPVVSPGVRPSAHLHQFFSNTAVTEFSTTDQLQASTSTTCDNPEFNSGMWIPAMYVNGVQKNPKFIVDYWFARDNLKVAPWPLGLALVAGDSHATSPPPMNALFWDCGGSSKPSQTPYACSSGHVTAHLIFPNCSDGTTGVLDPGIVYPEPYPIAFNMRPPMTPCPASNPLILAQLHMNVNTGLTNPAGLSFASGPYYTLHGDYWQTFHDQAYFANTVVDGCLNNGVGCGVK